MNHPIPDRLGQRPMRRAAQSRSVLRLSLAGAWLLALAMAGAMPAAAQDGSIPTIDETVTDLTGELAADRAEAEAAIEDLRERENVQLFALFVDTTDDLTITEFVEAAAEENSLGGNDALLAVALEDRTDALWVGSSLDEVTSDEIDAILVETVEPRLADGDYAGSIVAGASALGIANSTSGTGPVTGVDPGQPDPEPGTVGEPEPGSVGEPAGGTINLIPIIAVVLLLGGGLIAWNAFSSRRKEQGAAEERDRQTGALAREANASIIRTDEAYRDAEQELGFAEAQFTPTDVVPFREALAKGREELKAAFAIRQQLDDEVPEDPATRQRLLEEIVGRVKKAQQLLDEQRARLDKLRDLERTAPDLLAALPGEINAVEGRVPEVEATLQALRAYPESSWAAVRGNVVEAQKRLAFARTQVETGTTELKAGNRAAAARATRGAQEAVGQATRLLDAVAHMSRSLDEARRNLAAELSAASADVGAARAALTAGRVTGFEARLAEAEATLAAAQREAAAPTPDVIGAHKLASQANATADEILARIRQADEQAARAKALLAQTLQSAEQTYVQVQDFIVARSGGIGREARTRLAEAERHLERARALAASEPATALAEAQRAESLADAAYTLAVNDFEQYDQYGVDPFGGLFGGMGGGSAGSGAFGGSGGIFTGGYRRRRGGGQLAGAILGGILSGGMGGGFGGGFGGTRWGSPGGSGGFGGFGGGRSSGGSFGGGRSSGGRW